MRIVSDPRKPLCCDKTRLLIRTMTSRVVDLAPPPVYTRCAVVPPNQAKEIEDASRLFERPIDQNSWTREFGYQHWERTRKMAGAESRFSLQLDSPGKGFLGNPTG